MTKAFEVGSPEFADDPDENTIELVLSAHDMLALSRPAGAEKAAARVVETRPSSEDPASAAEKSSAGDTVRIDRWPLARVTGVLGIAVAVIALGSAAHRASNRNASAPAIAIKTPSAAAPAAPQSAGPVGPPVRFKNPFDASEVFEFPPGTSKAEARRAVAELLVQRARDRQSRPGGMKRVRNTRAAPSSA
jgi:hypothetical protein